MNYCDMKKVYTFIDADFNVPRFEAFIEQNQVYSYSGGDSMTVFPSGACVHPQPERWDPSNYDN